MVKNYTHKQVLSTDITIISLDNLVENILQRKNITVAFCNINSIVRADKNNFFDKVLESFTFRVADGMPIVWSLRLNKIKQERLNATKVLYKVIESGLDSNKKHYFLGSSEIVLKSMINNLRLKYPSINICGYWSPPMADLDTILEETNTKISEINKSDVLWVGLGLPKQEELIYKLSNVQTNTLGIGAAFEWVAGTKKHAPQLIQNLGFEWLFRLITEPKRLWRRYTFDTIYLLKILLSKLLRVK